MTGRRSLAQEVIGQMGEVFDALHPHGGARLGVGAVDEVVLLLPQEMALQRLLRGAHCGQVMAEANVLDAGVHLALKRKKTNIKGIYVPEDVVSLPYDMESELSVPHC